MPPPPHVDFSQAPFLVIWETTRSCALACKHCRAQAMPERIPGELTTEEGKRLLEQTAAMGTPIFIFSGGDCLNREDLEELIGHGKSLGLRLGAIPAATPQLTAQRVAALKSAGLDQIAFSIDGPDASRHDAFRGVAGSFAKTMEGVAFAHAAGLPLQINTCLASWNFPYLEELVELVRGLRVSFWEVFFLIPMGRGQQMESLTAPQFEDVFERMHLLNDQENFIIKLTEAPQYRRFIMGRESVDARVRHILARPRGVKGAIGMSPQAINSGKGFAFVDHMGNICPSGFLPIVAGNIRRDRLADVYRHAEIFRLLRDASLIKGKCGRCDYAEICSGSRARAYAVTGDALASDPYCGYIPGTA